MSKSVREIDAAEGWEILRDTPEATLIDVRTRAEWSFVGVPDLSPLGRDPVLAEWQSYPSMQTSPDFAATLIAHLRSAGREGGPLLFLCRSGARSRAAAQALAEAGVAARDIINIHDGFEGPPDPEGHRGRVAGWKAANLPWKQG